jgi:hypothetical protein
MPVLSTRRDLMRASLRTLVVAQTTKTQQVRGTAVGGASVFVTFICVAP